MPIVITIIAIIIGTLLHKIETGLVFGLIAGVASMQWLVRTKLRQQQELFKRALAGYARIDSVEQVSPASPEQSKPEPEVAAPKPQTSRAAEIPAEPAKTVASPEASTEPPPKPAAPRAYQPNWLDRLLARGQQAILSYFTDGNIFVRVGLLMLFFGVAFLLKYAAENSKIPLEFRFLGAAVVGMVLLFGGWRLRHKKQIYALLLQGGGIGVIYITIFASFQIANLIPSTLTFVLLVCFAGFTAALAVLQNSRALAIYAVLGGFLAPLLASTGSGNYIGLFSYYAALNGAIFAIAWFKSWRMLNLLGFVFTFGIYTLWFIFSYKTSMLIPAMGFLLLFFLMYSLIGILYAHKQSCQLKGLVDGSLVFGTPVIASSILMAMVRHMEYGIAIAAAGTGLYYVLLARLMWNRSGETMRLLSEALLAIGVVFATLAIPYSLDGHWTSATWALEAAGILWISIRQQRLYAQCFAILVQLGAGLLFLVRNVDDLGDGVWINPAFLGGLFVALGAFISARLLYQLDTSIRIRLLHTPFFVWAMLWWLGSALIQIDAYLDHVIAATLVLLMLTAGVLVYLDRIRRWNWLPASISVALLLPALGLLAVFSIQKNQHLLMLPDNLFWILALGLNYWAIQQLEKIDWRKELFVLLHTGFVVLATCVLALDLAWQFEYFMPATGDGFIALLTVFPLLSIYLARSARFPAIDRFGMPLQLAIIASLGLLLSLWSMLVNFTNTGDPAPLPYLPFINPLDLAHIAFFVTVIRALPLLQASLPEIKNRVLILLGGLIFIWLSGALLRSMHHYTDIPFDLLSMSRDAKIQTALSILWTIIGMLSMLIASRRRLRPVWIAGSVLIAVVLVKMFFIDLAASGTVERIVSFMVVGSLLVAMGYFSPIPKSEDEPQQDTGGFNNV
ncbi:MAG: DUF2339 domain-containing protein [Gammaproteobacteria bacterium]|nr:DUF2339 domain-containing protein [Gammaproteobacteria bacterium]